MCCENYFVVCVSAALVTIVQTCFHLIFILYGYLLSICISTPTQASSIFLYLTYFYKKQCGSLNLQPYNSTLTIFDNFLPLTFGFHSEILRNLTEILAKILQYGVLPETSPVSERSHHYFFLFIILDVLWMTSAICFLIGVCGRIKGALVFFAGPWLIVSFCVLLFDAIATVQFGLDLLKLHNFTDWFNFMRIENAAELEYLDEINPSPILPMLPTIIICTLTSRFIIIWFINLVLLISVLKSLKSIPKQPNKRVGNKEPDLPEDLNLDTSAARIHNWQLFYGAIETTSSNHSVSPSKDVICDQKSSPKQILPKSLLSSMPSEATLRPQITSSSSTFYYAYPDVVDGALESINSPLEELRSQLPWSYFNKRDGVVFLKQFDSKACLHRIDK